MLEFKNRRGDDLLRCEFRVSACGAVDRGVMEALACCIEDEYGDTYSDHRMYDVETLVEMVSEDRLMTATAIREDGEPVAVINLKECPPFGGVGDLSVHVVRRAFRSYGVGTPLVRYIMEIPETARLTGIVSHSATYHPIAQHESYRVGLQPCGALYGQHINALLSHSFEKVGVKQAFLVAACPKGKRDAGVLYLPEEHREFVLDCYRRMDVQCRVSLSAASPASNTVMETWQDERHQTLTGLVERCGTDLGKKTEELLKRWSAGNPLETATFFLNCGDPAARRGYETLRSLGFRFAGLHPLSRNGEYMILHHPMGVEVPFDSIHVDESYRSVFEYLRYHFGH